MWGSGHLDSEFPLSTLAGEPGQSCSADKEGSEWREIIFSAPGFAARAEQVHGKPLVSAVHRVAHALGLCIS